MNKNYTVEEVSEELRVSKRTILREIKRGKLHAVKTGRRYLISESELKTYLGRQDLEIGERIEKYIQSKESEMITLLQKMVSMETESTELGQEGRLASYINKYLRKNNIRSVLYLKDGHAAVRGSFGYADEGFLLDCPLDTTTAGDVSKWKYPPYDGVIKGGRIYGRGTADCKAGIVCMIYTLLALKEYVDEEKVRVELVFDGGEQNGEYRGMKMVLDKGLPVKAGIVGYAGDNDNIPIGARGYHRYTFTTRGEAAHTGFSKIRGVNAIDKMVNFIYEFNKIKLPKSKIKFFPQGSRKSFSIIEGGRQINIVPDICKAKIDFRISADLNKDYLDKLIKNLTEKQKKRDKDFRINATYDVGQEGYIIPKNDNMVRVMKKTLKSKLKKELPLIATGPAHIGNLLFERGIPIVIWGPRGSNVHSYNEYVELDSLAQTSEIYAHSILHYFKLSE